MNICIRQSVAAAICLVTWASTATAGDLWSGDPTPSTAAELGVIKWTGFYLTPYYGYETLKLNGTGKSGLKDPSGWRLGAEGGYDYEFSNHLVLGAAAEGYYTWYKGVGNALNSGAQTRMADYGTVRGKVGYTFDRFMIYGTGGAAFGDLSVKSPITGLSDKQTLTGWTAGAGFDWAYQKNLFIRFEVDHMAFGSSTFASLPAGQQKLGADLDLFKLTFISRF